MGDVVNHNGIAVQTADRKETDVLGRFSAYTSRPYGCCIRQEKFDKPPLSWYIKVSIYRAHPPSRAPRGAVFTISTGGFFMANEKIPLDRKSVV